MIGFLFLVLCDEGQMPAHGVCENGKIKKQLQEITHGISG